MVSELNLNNMKNNKLKKQRFGLPNHIQYKYLDNQNNKQGFKITYWKSGNIFHIGYYYQNKRINLFKWYNEIGFLKTIGTYNRSANGVYINIWERSN